MTPRPDGSTCGCEAGQCSGHTRRATPEEVKAKPDQCGICGKPEPVIGKKIYSGRLDAWCMGHDKKGGV